MRYYKVGGVSRKILQENLLRKSARVHAAGSFGRVFLDTLEQSEQILDTLMARRLTFEPSTTLREAHGAGRPRREPDHRGAGAGERDANSRKPRRRVQSKAAGTCTVNQY